MFAQKTGPKGRTVLSVVALLGLFSGAAHAAPNNTLSLLDPNPIDVTSSRGNTLVLEIFGDNNGGFGGEWPSSPVFADAPLPGLFSQTGNGNSLSLAIFGDNNLASIVQVGTDNTAIGYVSGINNAVAVSQSGVGNYAAFTQQGSGNALSISQSSW